MIIKEDYVSFEVAKLLKDKGFDEITEQSYTLSTGYDTRIPCCNSVNTDRVSKITLQMAMKWLREVHNIHIKVHCSGNRNYLVYAQSLVTAFPDFCIESATCSFNTYEEACEAAIKYCLENLI